MTQDNLEHCTIEQKTSSFTTIYKTIGRAERVILLKTLQWVCVIIAVGIASGFSIGISDVLFEYRAEIIKTLVGHFEQIVIVIGIAIFTAITLFIKRIFKK